MPCFIVAPDALEEKAAHLSKLAGQLGLEVSTAPDLDSLRAQPAFAQAAGALVLLADPGSDGALADAAIRFAQAEHGRAYIIYISEQITPEAYKRLLRTQAGEWSKWEGLALELGDVVQRLAGVEPVARAARVIAFLPSKGGVGNTTLALETAICLAARLKRSGRRIAILDLNVQGGTLADALDLEPRFDLRELTERPERLDNQLIDVFVSRYSESLDIFASPLRRTSAAQLDPQMIFSVLDLIAGRYDLILLDIPHQSLPWIDNLLLGSDAILVAGAGTVPALKQLAATLAHLDALSIEPGKIGVAVNQCDANLLGRIVRRGDIVGALPHRRVFFVRRDAAALAEANNAGRPLMELSPGNRVAKDVRRLATWIEDAVDQTRVLDRSGEAKRGIRP